MNKTSVAYTFYSGASAIRIERYTNTANNKFYPCEMSKRTIYSQPQTELKMESTTTRAKKKKTHSDAEPKQINICT